jgi:hypothetical protein
MEKKKNPFTEMKTTIPGSCARHCFITDECRKLRGDAGAVDEALSRIRKTLEECMDGWGHDKGVTFHLLMTVERPK